MITINPIKLSGNLFERTDWFDGFALDLHTLSSEFLGHDEYGREVFDTKRSEMGELLYNLKYKSDASTLKDILAVTVDFLSNKWRISNSLHGIIPVPPSKSRPFQPVLEIAKGISSELQIPFYENLLQKTHETPELKSVYDYQKRIDVLKNVFAVRDLSLQGKNVLLFDDLYRSGATLKTVTRTLSDKGMVGKVYVLALTKTRSKS